MNFRDIIDFSNINLYTLKEHYHIDIPKCFILKDSESEWHSLKDNHLIIFKGFSWDGCSPKFRLFGKIIGIYDGPTDPETGNPMLLIATLLHDCWYQFKLGDRKTGDLLFKYYGAPYRFIQVYYIAVRILGWAFYYT